VWDKHIKIGHWTHRTTGTVKQCLWDAQCKLVGSTQLSRRTDTAFAHRLEMIRSVHQVQTHPGMEEFEQVELASFVRRADAFLDGLPLLVLEKNLQEALDWYARVERAMQAVLQAEHAPKYGLRRRREPLEKNQDLVVLAEPETDGLAAGDPGPRLDSGLSTDESSSLSSEPDLQKPSPALRSRPLELSSARVSGRQRENQVALRGRLRKNQSTASAPEKPGSSRKHKGKRVRRPNAEIVFNSVRIIDSLEDNDVLAMNVLSIMRNNHRSFQDLHGAAANLVLDSVQWSLMEQERQLQDMTRSLVYRASMN